MSKKTRRQKRSKRDAEVRALRDAINRFLRYVDAHTAPSDGSRNIIDLPGAIELSQHADRIVGLTTTLLNELMPVERSESRVSKARFSIGDGGLDPTLVGALTRVMSVLSFDAERFNELQRVRPGRNHHLYRVGDSIAYADVAALESVERALALRIDIDRSGVKTQPPSGRKNSWRDVDQRARALLSVDSEFARATAKEWAKRLDCSPGQVCVLPSWKAVMEERRNSIQSRSSSPSAQALPRQIASREDEISKLIAEQEADHEPCPLDEGSQAVRADKRA